MKSVLFLLIFTAVLYSCNQNLVDEHNKPEILNSKTIDTNNPLAANVITGDSISEIINMHGDTLKTGQAIPFKPSKKEIAADIKKKPLRISEKSELTVPYPIIKDIQPSTTTFDESNLIAIPLGKGKNRDTTFNTFGEQIITGKPIEIKPEITRAINRKAVPVSNPAFKDNASTNIRYLDVDQGLPSAYIYDIEMDSLGRFWCATYGNGIFVYDGNTVQTFTTNEGLSSNYVRDLCFDKDGNLWIATEVSGLTKYDGSNFYNYNEKNGFISKIVYTVICDEEATIWTGNSIGVSKFDGEKFTHYTQKEGLSSKICWSLCADSKGNIWMGNDDGVVNKFDGENFIEYGEEQGIKNGSILSIVEDDQKNIWVSSMTHGVFCISGNVVSHISTDQGLTGTVITSIYQDKNSDIWMTSFGDGVFKYDGQNISRFDKKSGMNESRFWRTIEDKKGGLWAVSEGGGISVIKEESFQHYSEENGLTGNIIWAIENGYDNDLWMSVMGKGLIHKQDDQLTSYNSESGLTSDFILSIKCRKNGDLWLTSWGAGIDVVSDGQVVNYNSKNGLGSDHIFSVIEDRKGDIWIATASNGVVRYDGEAFYQFSENEGMGVKNVRSIFEDSKGNMWFATDGGGAAKFDGKNITHYTEKEGLAHNTVRCINEDKNGNIWIGSNTNGVSIFTGDRFLYLNVDNGLSNNRIRSIVKKSDSEFLIATEKGLNLVAFSGKENISCTVRTYLKEDGLKSLDFFLNSVAIDHDNKIWWGNGTNLVSVPMQKLKFGKDKPKMSMGTVEVNEQFINYNDTLENDQLTIAEPFTNAPKQTKLTHKKNNLTFFFAATDWTAPESIQYSFMLKGADENWSTPSYEAKANYRNLRSGDYSFLVKAKGAGGQWSAITKSSVQILPPFWKTWWAYIIYVALFGWLIYAIYQYQLKRQLAISEAERLTELNEMKTSFFTNISHEFRTPLTIITGLKSRLVKNYEDGKEKPFRKNMDVLHRNSAKLLTLVNQLLDISKLEHGAMTVNLEPLPVFEIMRNELSAYASESDEKKIKMNLVCDQPELTVEADEKMLLSIVHNLLGNAIKFTSNGTITSKIESQNENEVALIIQDTGIGIAKGELEQIFDRFYQVDNSSTKEFQGTGIGLAHVKQLMDLHKARIEVKSDLGMGTQFYLYFKRGEDLKQSEEVTSLLQDSGIQSTIDEPKNQIIDDRPKLLIVEDNEDMQYYISTILEDDYQIEVASNGVEGKEMAEKLVPDFIISDWMMPKMTGPELLEKLRKDVRTSHIPMMMLTARADDESRMKGYEKGADAYLVKPFAPEELKLRIKVLIDAQNRLKEFYANPNEIALEPNDERPKIEDDFIIKTIALIEENLTDSELTGDFLADKHFLSRSQFARKLRNLTGKSVTEYIREMRLSKAKELLVVGELNVSEIAYEVGFTDPAYFSRIFTKELGVSPSEWKGN